MTNKQINELYEYLTELGEYMPAFRSLTNEDQVSAINDTLMTLLKAHSLKRINLEEREVTKGYIFISLKNRCLRIIRNNKSHRQTINRVYEDLDQLYDEETPSINLNSFEDKDLVDEILKIVNRKKPKMAKTFELYVNGYLPTEIMNELSISDSCLWRRIMECRKAFK